MIEIITITIKTLTEIRTRLRSLGVTSDRHLALRASTDSVVRASASVRNSLCEIYFVLT